LFDACPFKWSESIGSFIAASFQFCVGKCDYEGKKWRDWPLNGTHQLPVYADDPDFSMRKNKYRKGNTDALLDVSKEN
jgi:hypothetical protein